MTDISMTSEQAKTLFWKMVQRVKKDGNHDNPFQDMVSVVHDMAEEITSLRSELHSLKTHHYDRQMRVKEIEEKIRKSSSQASSQINKKLQEIKEIEEQILKLESLHNHYSKNAPEHKESLKKIKEKIDLSKKKLNTLKF
jgi:chromosome segregation ATPase